MKQKLTLSATYVCSSVVEDRQFELAKALGVGDHVDLDDLPACDREAECPKQPSTRSHDNSHRPVHKRRSCEPGMARKGDRPLGPGPRTADLSRCARRAVGSNHDVRIEHSDERVEVTTA